MKCVKCASLENNPAVPIPQVRP